MLQLAAAASGCALSAGSSMQPNASRSRGSVPPRARDAKPYQRPGPKGRGGRGDATSLRGGVADKDCWLPGGFWWKDSQTPMPPGRQPGELAGWTPLAGERAQQLLQDQKMVLSRQEQLVQARPPRNILPTHHVIELVFRMIAQDDASRHCFTALLHSILSMASSGPREPG